MNSSSVTSSLNIRTILIEQYIMRQMLAALALASLCTSFLGCGGGVAKDTAYPVSGKVTSGGAPLAGYLISFSPMAGGKDGASATIGDDGSYTLSALDGRPGCPAGKYKVAIKPGAAAMQAAMKNMSGPGTGGPPSADSKVPADWSKEVEVKAQSNTIDIAI